MNRTFIATFFIFFAATPASAQAMFTSQRQAQQHCPTDTVVWLNLPTGIYHMQGERWYGATKRGAYVCEREADKAGDRETRNGQ
jgi:hypothetical protein